METFGYPAVKNRQGETAAPMGHRIDAERTDVLAVLSIATERNPPQRFSGTLCLNAETVYLGIDRLAPFPMSQTIPGNAEAFDITASSANPTERAPRRAERIGKHVSAENDS